MSVLLSLKTSINHDHIGDGMLYYTRGIDMNGKVRHIHNVVHITGDV